MSIAIHQGDCLDVLRGMAAESVDAVVTDPPAGIGFMGKSWDKDKGGRREWVAWLTGIMTETKRVMKPGAYALVWALPRTSHWTGWAIEDSGLLIQDRISHLFGCLSEDTEVLINGEWVHYRKAEIGSLALCYNADTDDYYWLPIEDTYEYEYCGTAYRIQSDQTNQIVSRNHRCLVERGGKYVFQYAETLEQEVRVPVLESLHGMPDYLPLPHEGAGGAQQDVLTAMHRGPAQSAETANPKTAAGLQELREGVSSEKPVCKKQGGDVRLSMPGRMAFQDTGAAGQDEGSRQDGPLGMDRGIRTIVSGENDRRKQPGMEGRRYLLQEARQLQADQVCSMPGQVQQHGQERRLCDGASASGGDGHTKAAVAAGSGASHQPRSARQPDRKPVPVREQQGPQTARTPRTTRSSLARVGPVHYAGKVWCLKVPTGAFVVRRKGKIFVTGNSGFPKSKTHLKPACEDWWLAYKKGPRGLNIEACRVAGTVTSNPLVRNANGYRSTGLSQGDSGREVISEGRWPANVTHDGSDEVVALFPDSKSSATPRNRKPKADRTQWRNGGGEYGKTMEYGDTGSAARFFYTAKASKSDRDDGLYWREPDPSSTYGQFQGTDEHSPKGDHNRRRNHHPTCKSTELMRWLCRLITPPDGVILDPFMGSGSTGKAAVIENFSFIGIEREAEYVEIARARIIQAQGPLFAGDTAR